MDKLKEVIDNKYGVSNYKLENIYRKKYDNDMTFRKICNDTKIDTDILMKYTSKLEQVALECDNCKNCPNIMECKNEVIGYRYNVNPIDGGLEFSYLACKYKEEIDLDNQDMDNAYYFTIPKEIRRARVKDIKTSDKKRYPVIKWIKEYLDSQAKGEYHKGLYLNGSFGCGKTYLLAAMLNEIARRGKRIAIIYEPEFVRSLKESFNDTDEYKNKFNYIKKVDYLLLDDIGAGTVTEWMRDEVLGPILQYRMDEKLPTFFTSNLTLEELEELLSNTKKEVDIVKARRIIERIKQLTDSMTLISVNLRK